MGFGVNMSQAKEIHKKNIRDARDLKFPGLDVEFQKAQETGSDTAAIIAKKQVLRDAPAATAIDAASTPDELKAQWDTANLGPSPYA